MDGINIVVVTKDPLHRIALIRVIAETAGIVPESKSESESAQRAHYAPAISRIIINTASPLMFEKLGPHVVVAALKVENRLAAAQRAKEIFKETGLTAEIHTNAEPEYPDGFIVFVTVKELDNIALMYWPKVIEPEIRASLPAREPWSQSMASA